MVKKQQSRAVQWICTVNLVFLVSMLVFTSYGPWFNERWAVVASMLWLLSIIPAMVASVYTVVAEKKQPRLLLALCWVTLAANGAVTASMFLFR